MRLKGITWQVFIGAIIAYNVNGCSSSLLNSSSHPSIDMAYSAFAQMDLDLSHNIFILVSEDTNIPTKDKVKALRALALQDWKFYQDYNSAKERLRKADSIGMDKSATWELYSRIERESGHYSDAQDAAKKAAVFAESKMDKQNASIAFAHAVYDQATQNLKDGTFLNRDLLHRASHELNSILAAEPGEPTASELLLGISLLIDDGPNALDAWRSYFWIRSQDSIRGNLSEPGRTLSNLLPNWKDRSLLKVEREKLACALAQSRFYDYAALIATDPRISKNESIQDLSQIHEILLYEEFVRSVKRKTEEFYHTTAVNGGRNSFFARCSAWLRDWAFDRTLNDEEKLLWGKLSFTGERPDFNEDLFKKEMEKRFGLVWHHQGLTNGYHDLLAGHIIQDETRVIEQYSYKAELRYVWMDRMISSGYSS